MKNIISATLYRITKTTAVKISFLLVTIAVACYFVLAHCVADGTLDASIASQMSALADPMMIWLFGSLMLGIVICQDFNSKAIHSAIASSGSRFSVVMSYAVVYAIVIVALNVPYIIASFISMAASIDYTGAEAAAVSIYLANTKYQLSDISILKLFYLYFVNAIVYVGSVSVCFPLAMKLKKPVVVTAVGFMFGMLFALVSSLCEKNEILNSIMKVTPFNYMLTNLNIETSVLSMTGALASAVVFFGLMVGLTYVLFRKEEIK